MSKLIKILVSFIWCTNAVSAEEIAGSNYGFGNWSGAAYTFKGTQEFSHCVISASYVSGDVLYFSVNKDTTIGVGVASPGLKLTAGQNFPVAIYVDRRQPFYGTAKAIEDNFAVLEISEFERALEAFKRGYNMVVQGEGRKGEYDLSGTFRALAMSKDCAINYFSYIGAPRKADNNNYSTVDKTVLFQISTEIISELGLTGFKYLTADELNEKNLPAESVFWESLETGISGGTLIIPLNNSDLRGSDAGDTKFLTSRCAGDFASSARNVAYDGTDVRELRVICLEENGQFETYMTKILLGNEVLYTLLTFFNNGNSESSDERQQRNETATLRAAKFVIE